MFPYKKRNFPLKTELEFEKKNQASFDKIPKRIRFYKKRSLTPFPSLSNPPILLILILKGIFPMGILLFFKPIRFIINNRLHMGKIYASSLFKN